VTHKPCWEDVVCASAGQVSSRLGEEVAVLALEGGVYYGLNVTAARIWELLREPIRVSEIGQALVSEYEIDAISARRDVLAILDELSGAGLIEVR